MSVPIDRTRSCRGSRLYQALLWAALLAIQPVWSAFAQGGAMQDAAVETDSFEQLSVEIDRLRGEIAELAPKLAGSEGLERRIIEARLGKARMQLLERNLELGRAAVALDAETPGYADKRQRAIQILDGQTNLTRTIAANIRGAIELPESGATAAEQAAAYSRIFESLQRLDEVYAIYLDGLELSSALGVDVSKLEARLRQELAERAATGSALLDISASEMTALRASLAVVPDDQEIKARLGVETANVTRLARSLDEILGLMDSLNVDTTRYRQQVLTVTGQITSDFFDVGVLSALVVGWGRILWDGLIESGPGLIFKIILFFIVVFLFYKLAHFVQRLIERGLANAQPQPSQLLQRMVLLVVRNTIIAIGILIALAQIGISLGPLLAGLGVVGFIVGFALQDTLSNFASGLMILIYRPFDVDDYVEAAGISGLVSSMSLVNTTILTFDNQTIVVPNNKIWGDVIRNVTAQKTRRVDLVFGISYSDDIPKAEKILKEVVDSHDTVLGEPEPMIRVHELGDSSVNIIVRPWVKTEDYWETYWSMMRTVKMRFDEEGITIPFPQRDVHLYQT